MRLKHITGHAQSPNLSIICPCCRERGQFSPVGHALWLEMEDGPASGGQFVCPNDRCLQRLFVIYKGANPLVVYPPSLIEFDVHDVPTPIVSAMEEALKCHACGCFKAAAVMIRRTIEVLCDANEASGRTLHDRLRSLESKVTLSRELLDGLQELKLLGNDAAHVELKDFDSIGREEIELAADIVKEILEGLYQHKTLVNRLQARRQLTGDK